MESQRQERRKDLPPKLATAGTYREWKIQMQLHFRRHGVWELVTGEERKPAEPAEIQKWERRQAGAHCDLLLCLGGDLKKLALAHQTLSSAWTAVKDACNLADEVELHQIEEEIEKFTGSPSVLITTTKLVSLFSRLVQAGGAISDNQKTLKLLKALPRNYDEFALNIKTNKTYRNENNTYNFEKIVRKVQQRAMVSEPTKASLKLSSRNAKVMKIKCYNCQEEGHTKWKCKKCFHCKQLGHRSKDCPNKTVTKMAKFDKFHVMKAASASEQSEPSGAVRFCLDSAATMHCASDRSIMINLRPLSKPISVETLDSVVKVTEVGDIRAHLPNGATIMMKDVALTPGTHSFVFSTARLTEKDWKVVLTKEFAELWTPDGEKFIKIPKGESRLYWISMQVVNEIVRKSEVDDVQDLWHDRLGHPAYTTLVRMQKQGTVTGLPVKMFSSTAWCDACGTAKLTSKPITKMTETHKLESEQPLEKIHVDTIGPLPVGGAEKFCYILHVVDDYSRYRWAFCVSKKTAIPEVLVGWMKKIQRVTERKIKNLKADMGTEFMNEKVANYCNAEGIVVDTSPPGVPQLNGAVERANRTLKEGLRSLLTAARLTKWYWPYAAKCATYLGNRLGTRTLPDFKSPFEVFWGKKPSVKHLRVFGAHGFALDGRPKRSLQNPGRPAMFLGYDTNKRAYMVKWLDTNVIGVARTGRWNERKLRGSFNHSTKPAECDLREVLDMFPSNLASTEQEKITRKSTADEHEEGEMIPEQNKNMQGWCDVVSDNIVNKPRERKPRTKFDPSDTARKAIVKMSRLEAPKHFKEIRHRPDSEEWFQSYFTEIDSLEKIGEFEIIDRNEVPSGQQILPVLELFKVKPDGRKKTRIVVRGDLQHDTDLDVYSPTANAVAVRLVVGLAAANDWKLRQLDVKNAYLHGRTETPTYIELPTGHPKKDGKQKVYKTFSSVYGLKQAPRVWNSTMHQFLISAGFTACPVEKCLYVKGTFLLILYVDDVLYCAKTQSEIDDFEKMIQKRFSVTIEPQVKRFLGFEIVEDADGITLKQEEYVKRLIQTFRLQNARAVSVPMQSGLDLNANNGEEMSDNHLYQALLGALLYINLQTRPDICYSINVLSRHAKTPTTTHLRLLKHVARYLKGTSGLGLRFNRSKKMNLYLFVDSSWANGPARKSMFGFFVMLNGVPVSFRTKRQSIVALSTTEAEYIGMCEGVKELLFVRNMMNFLGFKISEPLMVYNDNQGAINIGRDLTSVSRTKHISMKYFFIQELVEKGQISLEYIRTDQMLADILTKPLGKSAFCKLRRSLLYSEVRQDEEGVGFEPQ